MTETRSLPDEHWVTFFETAIGECAIAWTDRGIAGVQLPEATATATRARILRRFQTAAEGEPTLEVRAAIEGIVALLSGEAADLRFVQLDLRSQSAFNAAVYALARDIRAGRDVDLR